MKKTGIIVMLMIFCIFVGCGNKDELGENTVEVSQKGWIKATVHETFDKDYYDKKELQTMVENAIEEYNSSAGSERIELNTLSVKGNAAHATITYAGDEDYEKFNQIGIYNGTVKEMDETIYDAQAELMDQNGDKIPLRNLILSDDSYHLAILQETCILETSGKILYTSSNVELKGKKTAEVTADHKSYAYVVYE